MPLDELIADEATEQYAREYDRYAKLARLVEARCQSIVRNAGIRATFQSRAKDPASFRRKLHRYLESGDLEKIDQVDSPRAALEMIGDLAGVRVATYVEADRGRVVELIKTNFRGTLMGGAMDVDEKNRDSGYRATHCQVLLPDDLLGTLDVFNIEDTSAEIQICSMLGHVWNEIEHDLRYKVPVTWGDDIAFRDKTLTSLRRAADEGDHDIETLLGLQSEKIAKSLCPQIAAKLLQLTDFDVNGVEVLREVVRLGYSTIEKIEALFDLEHPTSAVDRGRELIGQHLVDFKLNGVPADLHLDPANADVLLALLIDKHAPDLVALYARQLKPEYLGADSEAAPRAALVAKTVLEVRPSNSLET